MISQERSENTPLLATKVQPPQLHPAVMARLELIRRLDAGLAGRMTLVVAPPGYGKTTLVRSWIRTRTGPVAWLTLDENDNDPFLFIEYLTDALKKAYPEFNGNWAGDLRRMETVSIETCARLIVNDLASLDRPLMLTLDDYHLIRNTQIDDLLMFILDQSIPGFHLTTMTREEPAWPLARLIGRGHALVLRRKDLRFDIEETKSFLKDIQGLSLSLEETAELAEKTEGWPTGLQLAAATLKASDSKTLSWKGMIGNRDYLFNYLSDEVVALQPVAIQRFLEQSSIFDRFCAPLCEQASGMTDCAALIEVIEKTNLFLVSLDENKTWFRYHRLFAEHLRRRLIGSGSKLIPVLHRRAADWFESEGMIKEAVDHALAAADHDRAAGLIENTQFALLMKEQFHTLIHWCDAFPDQAFLDHPRLCIGYAWALLFTLAHDRLKIVIDLAVQACQKRRESIVDLSLAAIQAFSAFWRGDYEQALLLTETTRQNFSVADSHEERLIQIALDYTSGMTLERMGDFDAAEKAFRAILDLSRNIRATSLDFGAAGRLARILMIRGKMDDSRRILLRCLDEHQHKSSLVDGRYKGGSVRELYFFLADLHYEWNDLAAAETALESAVSEQPLLIVSYQNVSGFAAYSRLKRAQGRMEEALELLERAVYVRSRLRHLPEILQDNLDYRLMSGRLLLTREGTAPRRYLDEVARWVQRRNLEKMVVGPADLRNQEILLLLLLVQERYNKVSSLLPPLISLSAEVGHVRSLVFFTILDAISLQQAGRRQEAGAAAREALVEAEPEGYVRMFIDFGQILAPLLEMNRSDEALAFYIEKLLSALGDDRLGYGPAGGQTVHEDGLFEKLTSREKEILQFIGDLHSNAQIASNLSISVNTVKWYVKIIYDKLCVSSRREAVAKAKRMGLI